MKNRSLISSILLAAGLGLGINAPAQAGHDKYTHWSYGWDDHPHQERYYYDGHHHHKPFMKFFKRHHWRQHQDDHHGRGHDGNRDYDRRHHDRGRDQARYDGHDRHRRH